MRQEAGLLENQASYFREIGERGFVAEFSQFGTGDLIAKFRFVSEGEQRFLASGLSASLCDGESLFELAPNAGPGRLGNSGFIRGSAGRGCRAADEARSAFCRRGSYADERCYSLYAKPRIFAGLRRGSGTSWRSGTLNGTCR